MHFWKFNWPDFDQKRRYTLFWDVINDFEKKKIKFCLALRPQSPIFKGSYGDNNSYGRDAPTKLMTSKENLVSKIWLKRSSQ